MLILILYKTVIIIIIIFIILLSYSLVLPDLSPPDPKLTPPIQ